MTDKINVAVPVRLGGKQRSLKYTLGALKKFQDMTGIDTVSQGINIEYLEPEKFRAFIYAGLLDAEPLLRYRRARRFIKKDNAVELVGSAGIAFKMSMPDPPEKSGKKGRTVEEAKPTDWLEIWRYGRMCLRLSDAGLWGLTMAQFTALAQEQGWEEYRGAFLCMCFANYLRDPKKSKPFIAGDFMPERWGVKHQRETDPEVVEKKIDAVMYMFGGKPRQPEGKDG